MAKLLLRVMSSVEELRQTQKQHTAMLQSVMKALQAPSRSTETTMPAGVTFPLSSLEDVDKLNEHLQNEKTKETVVRIYKFLNGTFFGNVGLPFSPKETYALGGHERCVIVCSSSSYCFSNAVHSTTVD